MHLPAAICTGLRIGLPPPGLGDQSTASPRHILIMHPAVFALSLAAFCIGSTELVISGILLGVSTDLGVSIPAAGLLVTGYAAGVAIGGPLLGLVMGRIPLRASILGVSALFALGQLFCAFAASYEWLLVARLVSAAGHGVFFGVGSVAVAHLVPVERRGAALSLFVGGITVASIIGLPAGTALGNAFGWRSAFVAIAIVAVLAVIALWFAVPRQIDGEEEADAPLASQVRQLLHQEVFLSYLVIALIMTGQIAFTTYQVVILTEITRIEPIVMVPVYLLIGGAGAIVGIFFGGRGADWNAGRTMLIVLAGQIASFGILYFLLPSPIGMGVMLFIVSALGFAFSTPLQVRILHGARAAPRLASTLSSSAFNVGIAIGAAIGALLISTGYGYGVLPLTGLLCSSAALLFFLLSLNLSRNGVA
jgi:DHA1 family inner membrane transport protein